MVWTILNADQNAALKEIVQFQSDRISAILGGAMLDDSLRRALEHRLRPDKDINDKLFRVTGPLGNTSPKIDLGYQLHVFEKPMRNAMYGIAEIRNLFAHDMSISFSSTSKRMTDSFNKMKLHEGLTTYPLPGPAISRMDYDIEPIADKRSHYVVNLKLALMWLAGEFHRNSPHLLSSLPRT
jgi:hypothetical protein